MRTLHVAAAVAKNIHARTTVRYPRPSLETADEGVSPDVLAVQLDAWALRREKVIFVLDRAQAKVARDLAERCRVFVATTRAVESTPELRQTWQTIREEAAALFASGADAGAPFDPKKRLGDE